MLKNLIFLTILLFSTDQGHCEAAEDDDSGEQMIGNNVNVRISIMQIVSSKSKAHLRPPCGRTGTDAEGNPTYPWVLRLSPTEALEDSVCAASLITAKWALTAGHCTDYFGLLGLEYIYVFLGVGSDNVDMIRSNEFFKMYSFSYMDSEHDIGLVRLETSAPAQYEPICLPKSSDALSGIAEVRAAGWGSSLNTTEAVWDVKPEEATFVMEALQDCTNDEISTLSTVIDNGGGLFGKENGGDHWIQFGIVGMDFLHCSSSSGVPVSYTDVHESVPWIKEKTKY